MLAVPECQLSAINPRSDCLFIADVRTHLISLSSVHKL